MWKESMRTWRRRKDRYLDIKIFLDPFFYTRWVGLSQKTISRYCPMKPPSQKKYN